MRDNWINDVKSRRDILHRDIPDKLDDIIKSVKTMPIYLGPGEWYRLIKKINRRKK